MKRILTEIKKIISTRDTIPKAICLLLSVILWVYVNSTKVGEVKFRIPVEITNLSEDYMVLEGINKNITVTLMGRKDLVKSVNIKNINASLDLQHPEIGVTKKYPLKIKKHGIPENVEVNLSATELVLTVEKKVQKRVWIEPDIQKTTRKDLIIGNVKTDPSSVLIEGPESLVKDINSVPTIPLFIGNEKGRLLREVALNKENFENVNLNVSQVKVMIPVFEPAGLYDFEVRIDLKNIQEKYKYVLSRQYVKIYIRYKEEDAEPDKDDISASIDMSDLDLEELFKRTGLNSIERDFKVDIKLGDDDIDLVAVVPEIVYIKIAKL